MSPRHFSSFGLLAALGLLLPAGQARAELSCSDPCTEGTLAASGAFYDVFVGCDTGAYSAATGASHSSTISAGAAQNVIYGGAAGDTGTSQLSLYLHDLGEHYTSSPAPIGSTEVLPMGSCAFTPAATDSEPDAAGIETEWLVTDSSGASYRWRHEVVSFGDSESNAGVRLSQSVTPVENAPATTALGLRWQIDYQSAQDDGPVFASVECEPYTTLDPVTQEQEIPAEEILDFFKMVNNVGKPLVENYTSTAPLAGFADTQRPDRLLFGYWPTLYGEASWDYTADTGNDADQDSAVLIYFGYQASDALALADGETVRRSVVLFGGIDAEDCGEYEPVDTGDPEDTAPPEDSAPPQDSAPPDEEGFHYAGGLASCGCHAAAAAPAWLLLGGLAFIHRRRRDHRN